MESAPCPLAARQYQVLSLVTFTNKEIGKQLGISEQTVKNHLTNIGLRVSLHAGHAILGRTSLLIYAIQQGWITLGDVECWEGQCEMVEENY